MSLDCSTNIPYLRSVPNLSLDILLWDSVTHPNQIPRAETGLWSFSQEYRNQTFTMPSATGSRHTESLESILSSLQHSLSHHDSAQAQSQLQQAKLALLHHNALIPSSQTPTPTLATARSILEAGALLSIRSKDPQSFIRYYSQLQPFYDYSELQQNPSRDRSKITGLYLMLLLSQGDYAGFHTLLESLIVAESTNSFKSVEEDQYIKYPIEIERSLMEGSYDQVWRKTSGRDVPGEEFALFSGVSHPQRIT